MDAQNWTKKFTIEQGLYVAIDHFENAHGRRLRLDKYPVANLPQVMTQSRKRKPPTRRQVVESEEAQTQLDEQLENETKEVGVQTMESSINISDLNTELAELRAKQSASQFRLVNISTNS